MRIRSTAALVVTIAALAVATTGNNEGQVTDLHLGESGATASTTASAPHHPWWMRRACANEDSANCYWNARQQGNGRGKSFYVRRIPHTGKRHPLVCVFYVNRAESRYDQCWRYEGGGK